MPIVKTRTPAQMGKFLDAFLAKTVPAGCAGVAIFHAPDVVPDLLRGWRHQRDPELQSGAPA